MKIHLNKPTKFFQDNKYFNSFNKLSLNNDKSVSWTETSGSRIVSLNHPNIPQAFKKNFNESEITPIEEHKSGEHVADDQSSAESSTISLSIKNLVKDLKASKISPIINTEVKKKVHRHINMLPKSKSSLSYDLSPISKLNYINLI